MGSNPFDQAVLDAALKKLPDLPAEQGGVGVVTKDGEIGAEAVVNKQLGKGWYVEGQGSWFKRAGYSAAAWLGWKKR